MLDWGISTGGANQTDDERCLVQRQVSGILAELPHRRIFHAVSALAEIDSVQVDRQNLPLFKVSLNLLGKAEFNSLPTNSVAIGNLPTRNLPRIHASRLDARKQVGNRGANRPTCLGLPLCGEESVDDVLPKQVAWDHMRQRACSNLNLRGCDGIAPVKLSYRRQVGGVKVQPAAHCAKGHNNRHTSGRHDSAERLHGMS